MSDVSKSPDPLPEETTGLTPGNSVQPGDTPPAESGMSGVSYNEPKLPTKGANAAIAIGIVVLVVAIGLALFVRAL